MNSSSHRLQLTTKDGCKDFQLDLEKIQSQTGTETISFYVGDSGSQKTVGDNPNHYDKEEDRHMRAVHELLADFSEEDFKNVIDFVIDSERDEQYYNLSMRFRFTPAFLRKLSRILIEPKMCIRGKFESETEFLLPYSCRASPLHNGKPFSGTFSAIANIYQESQSVTNFEGANRIEHCIRTHVASTATFKFTFSVTLLWTGFGGIIARETCSLFENLLKDKLFMDCSIIPSNKRKVYCHKNIIAAQSDVLRELLKNGLPEPKSTIEMLDISEQAVKLLVEYFYRNKIENIDEIQEQITLELFQMAVRYEIRNLEGILMDNLYFKGKEWFSLDNVLCLYHFCGEREEYELLRDKMLGILRKNVKTLYGTEAFKEFSSRHHKEAASLCAILQYNLSLN
ncbi:unnamed protein product [Orchesella dallaii]|uniref:BTB domain-containing protein n=1 Tax=Orchesella dallaii TaxID=48710 RepID=A0ABP1RPW6_9HEXA